MIKNILAVILGLVIGSVVNMGLIILGAEIFPLKEGFEKLNVNSLDSLVDDKKIKNTNTPNNIKICLLIKFLNNSTNIYKNSG